MTAIEVRKGDPVTASSGLTLQPRDFGELVQFADTIARTGIIPDAYRGKPNDIVAACVLGAELGFDVMTSLRNVFVVKGKPTVSAEGMVALVRRAGHSISGEKSSDSATVTGKRRDTGDTHTETWTMQDAANAGLLGNDVWHKYPGNMCWARATSNLCRALFSDVIQGLYVEGELDVVEAEATVLSSEPQGDPAPVPVTNTETGEVEQVRQPEQERLTPEQRVSLLSEYATLTPETQSKIDGFVDSIEDQHGKSMGWSLDEESLASMDKATAMRIVGLVSRAFIGETVGGFDTEERETLDMFCDQQDIPRWVDGWWGQVDASKRLVWIGQLGAQVRAIAGLEPFGSVPPAEPKKEEVVDEDGIAEATIVEEAS